MSLQLDLVMMHYVYQLSLGSSHLSLLLSHLQFTSVTQSCPTLCDSMDCNTPGLSVNHQIPEFTQTLLHWVNDAIQPLHPLSTPSPPAFNLSQHQGLFKWVSSSHQVAKVLELQLQISPSNEYSGLISFRMDWLDLFAVQGTLKSLLQHHSSKVSILLCSAFLMVKLSHPYTTAGKTIALTRWIFVNKVMHLLFNMLSRLVIIFLPRSKHLLISWPQSPSAVILETKKTAVFLVTVSTGSPSICQEVMGPDAMIFVFWMLSFKPKCSLSYFTFIKRFFSSSLSAIRWCHLHIWGYWYFSRQSWFQLMLHPAWHFSWCTPHRS